MSGGVCGYLGSLCRPFPFGRHSLFKSIHLEPVLLKLVRVTSFKVIPKKMRGHRKDASVYVGPKLLRTGPGKATPPIPPQSQHKQPNGHQSKKQNRCPRGEGVWEFSFLFFFLGGVQGGGGGKFYQIRGFRTTDVSKKKKNCATMMSLFILFTAGQR